MHVPRRVPLVIFLSMVFGFDICAQSPGNRSFDVVSVKRVDTLDGMTSDENDVRIRYHAVPLSALIRRAYQVRPDQVQFLHKPGVFDVYDVVGNLPAGSSRRDIPSMLRNMLLDRFRLVSHWEQRETKVYVLDLTEGGTRFRPAETDTAPSESAENLAHTNPTTGVMHFRGVMAFERFCQQLSSSLHRLTGMPLVDKTGISGRFHVDLDLRLPTAAPQPSGVADGSGSDDAPEMRAALKSVGLTIRSAKEPVNYLVVEKYERDPAQND